MEHHSTKTTFMAKVIFWYSFGIFWQFGQFWKWSEFKELSSILEASLPRINFSTQFPLSNLNIWETSSWPLTDPFSQHDEGLFLHHQSGTFWIIFQPSLYLASSIVYPIFNWQNQKGPWKRSPTMSRRIKDVIRFFCQRLNFYPIRISTMGTKKFFPYKYEAEIPCWKLLHLLTQTVKYALKKTCQNVNNFWMQGPGQVMWMF